MRNVEIINHSNIFLATLTRLGGAKIAPFIGDQSAKVSQSEEWWREGLQ